MDPAKAGAQIAGELPEELGPVPVPASRPQTPPLEGTLTMGQSAWVRRALPMVFVACWRWGGCASGSESPSTTSENQTFDCISAIAGLGLTTETPVGVARERLEDALASAATAEERDYYAALLGTLKESDPAEPVGALLDDVPCTL